MDKFAKRILKEEVKPALEKLLGNGISEKEFEFIKEAVCIAKDLIECDILLMKLNKMKQEGYKYEELEDDDDFEGNPKSKRKSE